MIRRQAWFLGKPVHALATGAIHRKNTEIDEIFQENAWNEWVNAVFNGRFSDSELSTRDSADAECLELAMQGRTLHADKLRRARDITRESADLGDQIVAFEHLPRLTQWQAHDVLAIIAGRHGRNH